MTDATICQGCREAAEYSRAHGHGYVHCDACGVQVRASRKRSPEARAPRPRRPRTELDLLRDAACMAARDGREHPGGIAFDPDGPRSDRDPDAWLEPDRRAYLQRGRELMRRLEDLEASGHAGDVDAQRAAGVLRWLMARAKALTASTRGQGGTPIERRLPPLVGAAFAAEDVRARWARALQTTDREARRHATDQCRQHGVALLALVLRRWFPAAEHDSVNGQQDSSVEA